MFNNNTDEIAKFWIQLPRIFTNDEEINKIDIKHTSFVFNCNT